MEISRSGITIFSIMYSTILHCTAYTRRSPRRHTSHLPSRTPSVNGLRSRNFFRVQNLKC